MKKILIVVAMLIFAAPCMASTVILQWDANTEPDLAGYKVYQQVGTNTPPFTQIQTIPNGTQKATIPDLDSTKTYYFAVTAYNTTGQESAYSNIVQVLPFPKSPANVRSISIVIQP